MSRLATGMLLWCLACADPTARSRDPIADGDLLKAAFIYNFAKFTRWPGHALGAAGQPLRLCTAGSDELVAALGRLGDKTIHGRAVRVEEYQAGRAEPYCHVLYIAGSEHHRYRRLLEQMRGDPVLTVSETRGFAKTGGMIQLYRARVRMRFRVNLAAARASGLRLSARLLDLAEVIGNGAAP